MKKALNLLLIMLSIITITGCGGSPTEEPTVAEPTEEEIAKLLEGKVKVPDTLFKTKELVEAEFRALGLEVEFVVSNFEDKAVIHEHQLKAGECDSVSINAPNTEYFGRSEAGNKYGLYADIGATIIIGYAEHDFDGTIVEDEDNITTETSQPDTEQAPKKESEQEDRSKAPKYITRTYTSGDETAMSINVTIDTRILKWFGKSTRHHDKKFREIREYCENEYNISESNVPVYIIGYDEHGNTLFFYDSVSKERVTYKLDRNGNNVSDYTWLY